MAGPIFKVNKAVEPPPPGWEKLGMHPAYVLREFDDFEELQRFCRDHSTGREVAKRAGDAYTMACMALDEKVVAVPSKKAWPNAGERKAVLPHEFAHTWGLVHSDDKSGDWLFRDGSPAFPLSDRQVEMMRAMAQRALNIPQVPTKPTGGR